MDQTAPQEPLLIHDRRIRCPWCEKWEAAEAFVELQTPPKYPDQCGVVLKHGGTGGCKRIFSIRALRRPAKAIES